MKTNGSEIVIDQMSDKERVAGLSQMGRMSDDSFVGLLDKHRDEFFRYVHRNAWNASVAEGVFSSAVAQQRRKPFIGGPERSSPGDGINP